MILNVVLMLIQIILKLLQKILTKLSKYIIYMKNLKQIIRLLNNCCLAYTRVLKRNKKKVKFNKKIEVIPTKII